MHAIGRGAAKHPGMNNQLVTIQILAVGLMLATSACTTVVEKEPTTTSTTVTEETRMSHPIRGATSTQTTTTQY